MSWNGRFDCFSVFGDEQPGTEDYSEYKGHPVRFINEVLGDNLSPDQEELARAVVANDFTIAISGNATGKTMLAARLAVYFYKVYRKACEIYLVATSESQLKKALWKELTITIEKHPELFLKSTVLTKIVSEGAERTISAVVIPLSGTEASIEGKLSGSHVSGQKDDSIQVYLVDEADALPNAEAVWRAIESCLSGAGSKAVAMFNPRHPVGPLQEKARKGEGHVVYMSELDHPNVVHGPDINGHDPLPGAITRAKVIQRVHSWTRGLADDETEDSTCFYLPDYLAGVEGVTDKANNILPPLEEGWRKVESSEFDYMVLARYPSHGDKQLISMEWINTARAGYDSYIAKNGVNPPDYTNCSAGLDISDEEGKDFNVLSKRYGILLLPLVSWNGIDIELTAQRAASELENDDVSVINTDATGVGAGVAPIMARRFNMPAVKTHFGEKADKDCEYGDFANLKAQLYFDVREALRQGKLLLPPDESLIQELLAYSYDTNEAGKVTVSSKKEIHKKIGRSSDSSDSVALSYRSNGIFNGMDLS